MTKSLLLLIALLLSACAAAQDAPADSGSGSGSSASSGTGQPPQGHPPGGRNPAVEAALAACAQSLGASDGQRPDMAKMDACMSAKGFHKPQGGPPPGHGDGKGAPPSGTTSDAS